MKIYTTEAKNIPIIRAMFDGYIFRRVENGVGYVKCPDRYAAIIRNNGLELTETNEGE